MSLLLPYNRIFHRNIITWLTIIIVFVTFADGLKSQPKVVINEFMAANFTIIADEDGDFEDWIELYNRGSEPVNLSGWGLSDNYGLPFRWTFPDTIIAPGEYLLVWASGKNRSDSVLHTNFSISSAGEPLLLVTPSGNWADMVPPAVLPPDISYGRQPDGTGPFYFFNEPTPGLPNTGEVFYEILDPPFFSAPGGLYYDSLELVLFHPDPHATIIYTLDGSDPSLDNLNGAHFYFKNHYVENPGDEDGELLEGEIQSHQYSEPLMLQDRSAEPDRYTTISSTWHHQPDYFPQQPVKKGTVVRAIAIKEGALPASIASATYFIQPSDTLSSSSWDLPVFSLTTDPSYLFGYDDGIYVAGADFDQWRVQNPNQTITWYAHANFKRRGREAEYRGHLEFFDTTGTSLWSQGMGYRIHGGWARTLPQKSFRLYARNDYGNDFFRHPFFPDQPWEGYRRLLLRNSGQDWGRTLFRDGAIQNMILHLHFETQAFLPAVLYVNGEYWGIHNLRERYDKHYLARVFGVDEDNLDMISNYRVADEGDTLHLYETITFFEENDIAATESLEHIATLIDLENFTDYHIAQICMANKDWPHANNDIWRLRTGGFDPDAPPGHDGRWRWLMYDTDVAMGVWEGIEFDALSHATNPAAGNSTLFLRKLLENEDFATRFLNRFADLLNTSFLPHYTVPIMEWHKASIEPEIQNHIDRWSHPSDTASWKNSINIMRHFLLNRVPKQFDHLVNYFELEGLAEAQLNVSHPLHGHLRINTIELNGNTPGVGEEPYPWKGSYFKGIPLEIVAIPAKGYRFSHWSGDFRSRDSIITVVPDQHFSLTAHFEVTGEESLVHYWLFDSSLPNNLPIEGVYSSYSLPEGAKLEFHSPFPGYPYEEDHPLWRLGAMERRNKPTSLNYRAEGNQGISYSDADMRGIQIKQPLAFENNRAALIFHLPTTGIREPVFRFAARDEGAARALIIEYSDGQSDHWFVNTFAPPYLLLTEGYQLFELDFSNVAAAIDNPDFRIRIRFDAVDPYADEGNRVTFNNFSLDGIICKAWFVTSIAQNFGSVTPEGKHTVYCCSSMRYTLDPWENHILKDLLLDGRSMIKKIVWNEDDSGEFLMEGAYTNHTLTAVFEYDTTLFDPEEEKVIFYPNPVSDFLYISSAYPVDRIEVFTLTGELMLEMNNHGLHAMLDLRQLISGSYVVRVFTSEKVYTRIIQVLSY